MTNPGEILDGRFQIVAAAGAGGMGRVFRAVDYRTGEPVAVKVLAHGTGTSRERFEREVRVVAGLSHRGLVRYVGHGQTGDGTPYLAMEWLEGELLSDVLRRHGSGSPPSPPLSLGDTLALAIAMADAIDAAHSRGVVHRDLKPSNLLLAGGHTDRVKILDFGIAHLRDEPGLTRVGLVVGTPGYMAPEQMRSGDEIDARADVFAMGCVLFQCVTGRRAYPGIDPMAVMTKVLFDPPPRMSDLHPGVPPALDALVDAMLARAPSARPVDGGAVARELRAIERDLGAHGPRPPRPPGPRAGRLTIGERRIVSVVMVSPERARPAGPVADVTAETHESRLRAVAATTRRSDDLRAVLEEHGGVLDVLVDGSAVGTLASATRSAVDQAARAARCALALAARLRDRTLALATGLSEEGRTTPVSATAEVASRLLAARRGPGADRAPTGIAIDDLTRGLLPPSFVVEAAADGRHLLRGERDELAGPRLVLGRPTPCVGRDAELAMLEDAWAATRNGGGSHAVLVTAAPGMGKSRVAHELVRRLQQADGSAQIWTARVDSTHAGATFGLLARALRGTIGVAGGEPVAERRAKLRARVAAHVAPAAQARVAGFLGELLGLPADGDDSEPLRTARQAPAVMADQLQRAWLDFLRAEVAAQPVLLLLDDLQWGDLATVRFVDVALRELAGAPLMVVGLARPEVDEVFPRLWADRRPQRLPLTRLSTEASQRLVRHVLGDDVAASEVEALVVQSEGNPFFLEELVRVTADRPRSSAPETVLAMVHVRLQALAPEARRALRAASVFGDVCWASGIRSLVEAGAGDVDEDLTELVAREVLVERPGGRFADDRELAFRHPLIQQAAYAMLTEADRALGHQLAGAWLEARGEEDALVLAAHFERGHQAARAGRHFLAAALAAQRGGDAAATIARAEAGLACPVSDEERLALHVLLTDAHGWRHEIAAALAHGREALRRAEPTSAARFSTCSTILFFAPPDEFAAQLGRLLQVTPAAAAVSAYCACLSSAMHRLLRSGDGALADRVERRMQAVVAMSPHNLLARGFYHASLASREPWVREDPWKGLEAARLAIDELTQAGHLQMVQAATLGLGMCQWYLGALEDAERTLGELVRDGLPVMRGLALEYLTGVLTDLGRLDVASALAEEMIASTPVPVLQGIGRALLAEARLRQGQLDVAEHAASAARTQMVGSPLHGLSATITLAAVRLAQRRIDDARALADEAFAGYTARGAFGFRGGRARVVVAEARWAAGDRAGAREAIATAMARLDAGAERIPDPAYRRSFLERVPEHARIQTLARAWSTASALVA